MPHLTNLQSLLACICFLCFILMLKGAFNGSRNDNPLKLNGEDE